MNERGDLGVGRVLVAIFSTLTGFVGDQNEGEGDLVADPYGGGRRGGEKKKGGEGAAVVVTAGSAFGNNGRRRFFRWCSGDGRKENEGEGYCFLVVGVSGVW
ncbi:hypothetical protein HAX54_029237 [Datura stramonium]|uniref:Uncharacterized protein n=1 Tax=Datura stramonium TaxID=4076 RepID=A0ABS8SAB8_DATST|nr:hypothetical protein [Datura stramonium]